MPEEYTPQTQKAVSEKEAYGDRGVPESVLTPSEEFYSILRNEEERTPRIDKNRYLTNNNKNPFGQPLPDIKADYANQSDDVNGKSNKADIENQLSAEAGRLLKEEETKKELVDILNDPDTFGHKPLEKLGVYTEDIMDIIQGNTEAIIEGDQIGYKMSDGFKSTDDVIAMIKGMRVDQVSRTAIKALVDDSVRKAEAIQPGEDATFNYQKEFNNMKNSIVNDTANIQSLANDKIFGGRVFKDDLQEAIQMGSYKDMGITEEQIAHLDPTDDGKITEEDSTAIVSAIMNDDNLLRGYLTEYYTKASEQNFYNNLSPEVRRIREANQYTPQTMANQPKKTSQEITIDDI